MHVGIFNYSLNKYFANSCKKWRIYAVLRVPGFWLFGCFSVYLYNAHFFRGCRGGCCDLARDRGRGMGIRGKGGRCPVTKFLLKRQSPCKLCAIRVQKTCSAYVFVLYIGIVRQFKNVDPVRVWYGYAHWRNTSWFLNCVYFSHNSGNCRAICVQL